MGNLLRGKVEEVDGLSFNFTTLAEVLEDNSWRVESEKESLEFHYLYLNI